jgi:hypothetical protein
MARWYLIRALHGCEDYLALLVAFHNAVANQRRVATIHDLGHPVLPVDLYGVDHRNDGYIEPVCIKVSRVTLAAGVLRTPVEDRPDKGQLLSAPERNDAKRCGQTDSRVWMTAPQPIRLG